MLAVTESKLMTQIRMTKSSSCLTLKIISLSTSKRISNCKVIDYDDIAWSCAMPYNAIEIEMI